jgi:formylglycine-generating enzyme required for sulfatase activity
MARLIDTNRHPLVDGIPPDWASEWGQDPFGVYAAFTIGGVTQRLRWIPPGRFEMGLPDHEGGQSDREGPRHTVTMTRGFWMFDTACSEGLWEAVTGKPPEPRRGAGFPVTNVSWDDACSFIDRGNAMVQELELILPSEAQWEYACRAGTQTAYYFGMEIPKDSVCYDSPGPVPVGSLPANRWGLREMHGNISEWCEDSWHGNYEGAPTDGSAWIDGDAALRVLRGGSWYSVPRDVRSAFRDRHDPSNRNEGFGFRCVRAE